MKSPALSRKQWLARSAGTTWLALSFAIPPFPRHACGGELFLDAGDATIHGDGAQYLWRAESHCIGYWDDVQTHLSWEFDVTQPGNLTLEAIQACPAEAAGSEFEITLQENVPGSLLVTGRRFTSQTTKDWKTFINPRVGDVTLTATGRVTLALKLLRKSGDKGTINLRGLVLRGESFAAALPELPHGKTAGHSQRLKDSAVRFFESAPRTPLPPSLALELEFDSSEPAPADWKLAPSFTMTTMNPARWGRPGKPASRWTAYVSIEPGTSLYGTGEVAGPLMRNGRRTICWNTDAFAYNDKTWSLYQSHPWVLALRPDGSAFGVLADTTWQCEIDLTNGIHFVADGPPFGVIVIDPKNGKGSPQDVVKELANLTGKTPLPPLWAVGYQQCRYSYFPEARVREVAAGFRQRKIPCDVIWFDIDYMDGFRVFTFDKGHFPDPKKLNGDLHAQGFKTVWMIDPGVKVDEQYFVYQQGKAGDHWVKTAAGKEFHGDVWPGACAFPDFTRPETRTWWAELYKDFMAQGIDGVWNDMNEPAVFNVHSMTMPVDNLHRGGGDLTAGPHARYHNVYGRLMVQATREGIEAANPDKRPFVLTRANFIGGQRFAATWTGDNVADWEHLGYSIPMMLNLSLSGQPFCGPDIGGFEKDGDSALFARWMGMGALFPFARGHTAKGTRDKEPWAWGPEVEASCRRSLERRYRLLPYLYTLFREASVSGLPVARPLFFADPADPALREAGASFMLGDALLVSAQVHPDRTTSAPTPKGLWRSVSLVEGDDRDSNQPSLKIRGGSIIPLGRIIQNTTERSSDPLTLLVCLDEQGQARGELYEDAGEGYGYREGQYLLTRYEARREGDSVRVAIAGEEGKYMRPKREMVVELITEKGVIRQTGDETKGVRLAAVPRTSRPKVLLVGIDGLRADAMFVAHTPNLDDLMARGCWTDSASAADVTISGPGWSNILCGVWPDKHGARDNRFIGTRYDAYPHFFARLKEKRPELITAHFVSWPPIDEKILGRFPADYRAAFDAERQGGDERILPLACEALGVRDPDVTFVHFGNVDVVGHDHGFSSAVPEYLAAIEDADGKLGRLLEAVRSRSTYAEENWLVLVTTDHGGSLDGKHGRDEPAHRDVLFIASGMAASRGRLHQTVNQTDCPATVMTHLGVELDPGWDMDGRPVGLRGRTLLNQNIIFNGDAESASGCSSQKENTGAAGWRDRGAMTVVPYGAPDNLPDLHSPGPADRGRNFFCGGRDQLSEVTQAIDVGDLAGEIDAGRIDYELSAWLGGYAEQRDFAWIEAEFLSEQGAALSRAKVGPVTVEDRRREIGGKKRELTGLLERSTRGEVPLRTRRIEVRLVAEASEGDNDGYADNISLVLKPREW